MQVSFWCPFSGQTGVTTNSALISSFFAINYSYKNLILRNHFENSTLENILLNGFELTNSLDFDTGIDALFMQTATSLSSNTNTNSKANINNYTKELLRKRLDLLQGTNNNNINLYEKQFLESFKQLNSMTNHSYDFTFYDVQSALHNKSNRKILETSDVVVININQNKFLLDYIFGEEFQNYLKSLNTKIFYIIGNYNDYSTYNLKNIIKAYGVNKDEIGVIEYNRNLSDYCNSGNLIGYLFDNLTAKKSDESYTFINNLKDCTTKIFNVLQVDIENKKVGE